MQISQNQSWHLILIVIVMKCKSHRNTWHSILIIIFMKCKSHRITWYWILIVINMKCKSHRITWHSILIVIFMKCKSHRITWYRLSVAMLLCVFLFLSQILLIHYIYPLYNNHEKAYQHRLSYKVKCKRVLLISFLKSR